MHALTFCEGTLGMSVYTVANHKKRVQDRRNVECRRVRDIVSMHCRVLVCMCVVWNHTFKIIPLLLMTRGYLTFVLCYHKCITSETGTRNGSVCAHIILSLYKQASPYTCVRPLSAHNLHRSYVLKCNPMEALQVRVCVRGRVYEQVYVDMLSASHVALLTLTTGECRRFD